MSPDRTGSDGHAFVKRLECPDSGVLLAYAGDTLPALKREGVRLHLAHCDFCGAELRLLVEHAPAGEAEFVPAPLPLALLIIAGQSLPGGTPRASLCAGGPPRHIATGAAGIAAPPGPRKPHPDLGRRPGIESTPPTPYPSHGTFYG